MNKNNIKFMDFCAGIGGSRFGLESLGMKCVGYSEIDKNAEKTYQKFFGKKEKNFGDLMKIKINKLPDFDLLVAGFPCQSFSIVGKRKGMKDDRGKIIYGLIKIIEEKNISYFILENVKGLINHNKGKTFKNILSLLDKAGYNLYYRVLNSLDFGIPQMRERIYIIGIRKDLAKKDKNFQWLKSVKKYDIKKYLIDDRELIINYQKFHENFLKFLNNKYNKGLFNIKDLLKKEYLILDTRQSDLRLYRNKIPTLRRGRHGILYIKNGKIMKLSGFESLLLQGFPKKIANKVKNEISNSCLLSQSGNAITINVIKDVGKSLLDYIKN